MIKGIIYCDRPNSFPAPYYGLCTNPEAFKKELARLKVPFADWPQFIANAHSGATSHFFVNDGRITIVVTLRKTRHSLQEIHGILVHEAAHIWQEIRDSIGEKKPSAEFEAYTMQFLSQQLFYAYKKLKADGQLK